jgi:energy-coupling factor transporter ATP-binding protein EcfA2
MSTLWQRYGLRRNPFFQEPLADDGDGPALKSFFTGRAVDLANAMTQLTHDEQTRVVLLGAPGVGKTTLLNRLLSDVRQPDGFRLAWLVASLPPINLPKAATLQDFCIEVLRHVLDMRRQLQAERESDGRTTRATTAKIAGAAKKTLLPGKALWEQIERTVEGALTLSPQVLGVGVTTQFTAPHTGAAMWMPLTKQALVQLSLEAGRDLVIALNNAENLRDDIAERATSVLTEARDLFLTPHTHWVFAGTPDFFESVIRPKRQLSGIMGYPVLLPPLDEAAVEDLITQRYAALKLPHVAFVPPIAARDAGVLARAFVGDLRELLRALEMTVVRVAPVRAGTVNLIDAMVVIGHEQAELFRDAMTGAAWEHLTRVVLAQSREGSIIQRFREVDAVRVLAPMRQPTVNAHKKAWLAAGLIRADGRTGAAEWFTVTGEALLAMLPAAMADGITPATFLSRRDLSVDPLPSTTSVAQPVAKASKRPRIK